MPKFNLAINSQPATGGITFGSGQHKAGKTVQIVAIPAANYRFNRWSDGNTNAARPYTMGTVDSTLEAYFVAVANVTIVAGPHGSVRPVVTTTADVGTTISVTATADAGYVFHQWSDGSRVQNRDFTVTPGGLTMVAYFEAVTPAPAPVPTLWEQVQTWFTGSGWWKLAGVVLAGVLIGCLVGWLMFGGKSVLLSSDHPPAGGPTEAAKGDKPEPPKASIATPPPVPPAVAVPTAPVTPTTIVVQAPPAPPAPNVTVTNPVSVTAVINLPASPPPAPPVGGLQPPATPPPPPPMAATTTPVPMPAPHRHRPVVNNFNPVIDVIVE